MALTLRDMRSFLQKAYHSLNQNKINGIYAEIAFRDHVTRLGFERRISPGGWLLRPSRAFQNWPSVVAVFPDSVVPRTSYPVGRKPPAIPASIDAAAHRLTSANIRTYFCYPEEDMSHPSHLRWVGIERGVPKPPPPADIVGLLSSFQKRNRPYNFLRYRANVSGLGQDAVPVQFALESLRIYIQSQLYAEISDIDALFWGNRTVYAVEVKEKTRVTNDQGLGDWFGLDVGPFAKLAFFTAWNGAMRSLFVVREIDDEKTRDLKGWWAIEFKDIAKYASWVFRGGGPNMLRGPSAVIRLPARYFKKLDAQFLRQL